MDRIMEAKRTSRKQSGKSVCMNPAANLNRIATMAVKFLASQPIWKLVDDYREQSECENKTGRKSS
jgi:hypothetical protein